MGKNRRANTVSNKGQVAMPLASGQRLGLKEDGRADDVVGKDQTIVRPALDQNPFDKFIGALPAFGGTRTLKRWTAGLREDEA